MILDIGPKTIKMINNIIDESNTILWNGPAGYFENPNFANGSIEIARKLLKKINLIKFILLLVVEIQLHY